MARLTSGEKLTIRGARTAGGRSILAPRGYCVSVNPRAEVCGGTVTTFLFDEQTFGAYAFVGTVLTGSSGDVQADMICDFGTTAGANDIASIRMRYIPVSGTEFRIAETAAALISNPGTTYFSIKNEYRPALKLPRGVGARINGAPYTNSITMYVDYDLAYADQNVNPVPKPNITRSATTRYAPKPAGFVDGYRTTSVQTYRTVVLSAAMSLTLDPDATFASTTWNVGDGTITVGTTTSTTITVRFPVGFRYVVLTIVDNHGKVGRMVYPIWVHSDASPPLRRFQQNRDFTSDWRELELEFFAQDTSPLSIPRGTALCYWEDDPFWGETVPDAYRDQMIGWCKEDTTLFQKYQMRDTLVITGMGEWFNRFRPIPQRIFDPFVTPTSWFEMNDMYLDQLALYMFTNFSTGALLGNFFPSGITDYLKSLDITGGSLMAQIQYIVQGYYGKARFDSLNGLFLRRHPAYYTTAERAAMEYVDDLTAADHAFDHPPKILRRNFTQVASLLGGGSCLESQTNVIALARAPGLTPGDSNTEQDAPGQNLPSPIEVGQLKLLQLTGDHYAYLNNERESVPYDLLPNLDVIEPAWCEPITVSESAADSGLTLTLDPFLVKEVNISYSNPFEGAGKQISLTLEGLTDGDDAQYVPVEVDTTTPDDSEPPIDVTPVPPTPAPTIIPYSGLLPTKGIVLSNSTEKVARAYGFNPTSLAISYQDISGNLASLGVTSHSWGHSDPWNYLRFYSSTNVGIVKTEDQGAGSVAWTLLRTKASLFGGSYTAHKTLGSPFKRGWQAALCGSNSLVVSFDNFATSTQVNITGGAADFSSPRSLCDVAITRTAGHMYALVQSVSPGYFVFLYKSTDHGLTWTYTGTSIRVGHNFATGRIHIPYTRPGGAANVDDANLTITLAISDHDAANHYLNGYTVRSTDQGASFGAPTFGTAVANVLGDYTFAPLASFTHDSNYWWSIGGNNANAYPTATANNYASQIDFGASVSWTPDTGSFNIAYTGCNGVSTNPNAALFWHGRGTTQSINIKMTLDNGITWFGASPWASPNAGVAYAEFSLYPFQ